MAAFGEKGGSAEEAHRPSGAEFSRIVSLAFDAFISTDQAQRIVFFNKGAEEMFGYSQAEVLKEPLDILLPERFREVHRKQVEQFGSGAASSRIMAERRTAIFGLRKGGEEFPLEASISVVAAEQGKILTVVCRDITERKRAEREQQFLAEFSAVLASTLDYEETLRSIATLAVRFLADWCIVDLVEGDGHVHRLELTHADASKAPLAQEWRRVELDQEHAIHLTPVLETREPFLASRIPAGHLASIASTGEHRRLLDELRPTSMFALPLLAHGRLLGAITFISTSPGRHFGPEDMRVAGEPVHRAALAVENARLYRSAREAIRTRDEVLSIVAHDLRNPLHAIGLSAGLLLRRLPQDDDKIRKMIDTIVHSAERAERLIRDLVEVTRLETGQLFLERTREPVRELLVEAVEMLGPAAQDASIALAVQASERLPAVYLDRDRILQVLSNLIGNAIKFTPPGGRITVAAEKSREEVRFSVTDTGTGIAPEHLERIFDRFYQIHAGDRRGAGLGLHIAKSFVEAHGGRIWAESREGQGTTICFSVPVEPRRKKDGPILRVMRKWLGQWPFRGD
jgi:PAS domain S-box-containing protein